MDDIRQSKVHESEPAVKSKVNGNTTQVRFSPNDELIEKIKGLTELDLDQLLREIGSHLHKNNLEHLIDNAFQLEDLTGHVEELEDKVMELRKERDDLKRTVNKIRELI